MKLVVLISLSFLYDPSVMVLYMYVNFVIAELKATEKDPETTGVAFGVSLMCVEST